MRTKLKLFLLAACLPFVAHAAEPTEKDAVAMVQKALAYAKANGNDKLIAEVNAKSPQFVQGEMYTVVLAVADGKRLAHPMNAKLVGTVVTEMQDVDGKEFGKEMLEIAHTKGKGWVEFKYKNPVSGKIEPKKTYLEKSGDIFVSAGIYKN